MSSPADEKTSEKPSQQFIERTSQDSISAHKNEAGFSKHAPDPEEENINAKLANPLAGIPQDQLMRDGAAFSRQYGLEDLESEFTKGALIAQDPLAFEKLDMLTDDELEALRREQTHKWSQPFTLYW